MTALSRDSVAQTQHVDWLIRRAAQRRRNLAASVVPIAGTQMSVVATPDGKRIAFAWPRTRRAIEQGTNPNNPRQTFEHERTLMNLALVFKSNRRQIAHQQAMVQLAVWDYDDYMAPCQDDAGRDSLTFASHQRGDLQ